MTHQSQQPLNDSEIVTSVVSRTPPSQSEAPHPQNSPLSINQLLQAAVEKNASDIYLTYGAYPCLRLGNQMEPFPSEPLNDEIIETLMQELLTEDELDEFETTLELNTSTSWENKARFRINVYRQQKHNALVIRRIQTHIPTIEELNLPQAYPDLIMQKRGLVLVVGQTGCGKSTSLAAMIGHRNTHGFGHIITIEDPIEYVHNHNQCIISQRDIGIDTYSFGMALKNALRQHPDVILIGEIRDREAMEHAINYAETGHLCVATLHANNASQCIERILNFFPEEKHAQIRMNLSMNLRGVLSQRLVPTQNGERRLAVEIMLNEGLISKHIMEGKVSEIQDVMKANRNMGMQTFDQCLLDLYNEGAISEETALAESDHPSTIKLAIHQETTSQQLREAKVMTDNPITGARDMKPDSDF